MKNVLLILVAIFVVSACKSDDGAKHDTRQATPKAEKSGAVEEPTETEPAEEPTAGAPGPSDTGLEDHFGGIVEGATTAVVTQRRADTGVDFVGKPREADATWIGEFVQAIGPQTPGSEAVPKCLPTYTLVFNGPDGKVAEFAGVCSGNDIVVLVRKGQAFLANDNESALELLRGLAK